MMQKSGAFGSRLAGAGDAEAIHALYEAAKEWGRQGGSSDWDESYPNREILMEDLEQGRIYVHEEGARIVAAISLLKDWRIDIAPHAWEEEDACSLARLCVHPELQGRGLGESMMRMISERAKAMGFKATHHLASKSNPAANRLYERMGYLRKGELALYDTDFIAYELPL
ncbi:MAG TPA: GNAT family N-acetyltransferase [Rectinemataceae bacterium]|nr:GNAT family N-acetyltransferase [Rectinemataceae bacterium]